MTDIFDIICIGAALVDMVAKVERHPLEDDEVFVSELTLLSGGAAANTAYACAQIGLHSAFIGKLGKDDTFGSKIIHDFTEGGVNTAYLKYSPAHGTGSAYVALNEEGDRRIYAHSGAANYLSKEDIQEEELKATKTIFLSSLKNLEPFIEAAKIGKANRIPVLLNPGMLIIDQGFEKIKGLLTLLDILILSQREFSTLLNLDTLSNNEEKVRQKCDLLLGLGMKGIVITRGNKGALLVTEEEMGEVPPLEVNTVVDTTGAGDAFSAGFLYGFVENLSYETNDLLRDVQFGNYVASHCIQQLGARHGIPTQQEIQKYKVQLKTE